MRGFDFLNLNTFLTTDVKNVKNIQGQYLICSLALYYTGTKEAVK